jgi:hypothetical protein
MFPNVALLPLERRTKISDFFGLCVKRFTFAYERSCIRYRRPGHGRSLADPCGSAEANGDWHLPSPVPGLPSAVGRAEPVERVLSVGLGFVAPAIRTYQQAIQGCLGRKRDDLACHRRNAEPPQASIMGRRFSRAAVSEVGELSSPGLWARQPHRLSRALTCECSGLRGRAIDGNDRTWPRRRP